MTSIHVGIDIGGTFTDFVFLDEEGKRYFGKTLTTYPNPSDGFLNGLEDHLQKYGWRYDDIATIIHGTTLVVNALIERKGAKTALITTEGFRDQLEIATESRYDLYDLFVDHPSPLVPRHLRYTVKERILNDGTVLEPLDETAVKERFEKLRAEGVEAVAVCFLHSYRNGAHEARVREIAKEVAPDLYVSLSSEVSPEIREYQRTSTTAANVFVQPLVQRYLGKLENTMKERGFKGNFLMMLSGGGTCTIETAVRFPIRILESGPVGGTMAGAYYSENSKLNHLLVFDMGGTTAKASLVDHGKPLTTNEFEVGRAERFMKGSGVPVKVPVVEMIEIGAGGGSIAYVNQLGLLKVGPASASSDPGPACYDRGGRQPTVTDADLVLGYLNPDYFLGGEMKLSKTRAYESIEAEIAKPLGLDVVEAAWGIHEVVNENMAGAARIHAVEKGKDIRDYPLFASGGAGPVHVGHVAEILNVPTVMLPMGAGVNSAFGFLTSPLAFDFVRSFFGKLETLDWNYVMELLEDMEQEGKALLAQAGVTEGVEILRRAEMKYAGQTHEITVPLPNGALTSKSVPEVTENFKEAYAKLYAEAHDDMAIETLNWRVIVRGPKPALSVQVSEQRISKEAVPKAHRDVYFRTYKEYCQTPVYERQDLLPGAEIHGPAIVEERESTLVVAPGFILHVDHLWNLWMIKKEDRHDNV
ncbi:N-methylhydantoinase A [Geomicrobium halophilum]|uniref:N-methylhydantoinase A n=1 Tax=Geomicrobium halophilum TaxID=549000 RepID=A0A841PNS4_9BACL|nr:hydantoinase/oxoprolinase family protein [Geomicrobium halophilum]MBB6450420.1 N-methylhydantoinase A [Geomicrobium halophilum]